MPLPGKLSVGILEEDNPQDAYFRYRPLLIQEEGTYVEFADREDYPDQGAVRIVPDKNESSYFKVRMRRTGRYCLADLRGHAGVNDKIRPNKNYHSSPQENNMYIIYSDVIREGAKDAFVELAEGEIGPGNEYTTRTVAVRGEDGTLTVYEKADEQAVPEKTDRTLDPANYGEYVLDGRRVLVLAPDLILAGEAAAPEPKSAPKKEPAPPAPARAEEPERQEKPWISRNPALAPKPVRGGGTREQMFGAQTGLNPRRGKSLQEIIDDKWRHSRMEQLGHPVPGSACGIPVENPVERAVAAVKEAWQSPEARRVLMGGLCRVEGFSAAVAEAFADAVPKEAEEKLRELEEKRAEIEKDIARRKAEMTAKRPAPAEKADAGAILDSVAAYFAASGLPISRDEALQMVLAAAFGKVVLFTGGCGCDMNDAARLLARALGIRDFTEEAGASSLRRWQGVCFMPDANAVKGSSDTAAALAQRTGPGSRLWLVVRDNTSGDPIPACVTEKAVTVRLNAPLDIPFTRAARAEQALALTMESLENAFTFDGAADSDPTIAAFRERLAKHGCGVSRPALADMYDILQALVSLGVPAPEAADRAIAMRALPGLIASMPPRMLPAVREITEGLEKCRAFLKESVGIL